MQNLTTLGGGCYWCLEAFYQQIKGVESVVSGYAGGKIDYPTSTQVYTMTTGHAEVVQVTFNSKIISYKEILEIFFAMHDPTTINRQGSDVGEIYRSVIFYHNETQRKTATNMIENFAPTLYKDPIVTELTKYDKFWPADQESQNFYNNNRNAGYCQVIIDPKLQKLRAKFTTKLK